MIPERYKNIRIKNSILSNKDKEIIKQAVGAMPGHKSGKSLLLTGGTGTGKTYFAALVYNYTGLNKDL